jgi:DNA-binding MarR family transcriptional regulator
MSDKSFFKPTHLYKEYIILDLIEKNKDITQRELAKYLGIAVSMVNMILDDLEKNHYLKRKKHTSKTVEYLLSKQGYERRKVLNISYLSNSLKIYKSASENIEVFINQVIEKGFQKIFLYGAGEVSEILLQSILINNNSSIEIIGVIDDDINKQGQILLNTKIFSIETLKNIKHDGILIASYTNKSQIMKNLIDINYLGSNILNFFEQ